MRILINTHGDDSLVPEQVEWGDWIDLKAAEDVHMEAGEYRVISLGISMKLHPGTEALVAPRSSTFQRYGILLANSIGIIDHTYCGDNDIWGFPAYAVRSTDIHKGDRICQFRIIENQPMVSFEPVRTTGEADRGGFGSTGV